MFYCCYTGWLAGHADGPKFQAKFSDIQDACQPTSNIVIIVQPYSVRLVDRNNNMTETIVGNANQPSTALFLNTKTSTVLKACYPLNKTHIVVTSEEGSCIFNFKNDQVTPMDPPLNSAQYYIDINNYYITLCKTGKNITLNTFDKEKDKPVVLFDNFTQENQLSNDARIVKITESVFILFGVAKASQNKTGYMRVADIPNNTISSVCQISRSQAARGSDHDNNCHLLHPVLVYPVIERNTIIVVTSSHFLLLEVATPPTG